MPKTSEFFFISLGLHALLLMIYSLSKPVAIPHFFEATGPIPVGLKVDIKAGPKEKGGKGIDRQKGEEKNSKDQGLASNKNDVVNPEKETKDVGEGGKTKESVFQESIVNYEEPVYPRWAVKRGLEGRLRMRIKVSREGVPMDVELLESSKEASLDKSALDAAYRWRFKEHSSIYFVEKNIVFQLVN